MLVNLMEDIIKIENEYNTNFEILKNVINRSQKLHNKVKYKTFEEFERVMIQRILIELIEERSKRKLEKLKLTKNEKCVLLSGRTQTGKNEILAILAGNVVSDSDTGIRNSIGTSLDGKLGTRTLNVMVHRRRN
jgi:hypothetical protein